MDILDRRCADAGRDPGTVERTVVTATDPVADPEAFLAAMSTYAGLGITKVWVGSAGPDLPGWVARVGEHVLPRLRDL